MSQPQSGGRAAQLLAALAKDPALTQIKAISALNLEFGLMALSQGAGGTLVISLPRAGKGPAEIEYHGGTSPERTIALVPDA